MDDRDQGEREVDVAEPMYTCLHCNNDFRAGDGTVTADAAICDVCND